MTNQKICSNDCDKKTFSLEWLFLVGLLLYEEEPNIKQMLHELLQEL